MTVGAFTVTGVGPATLKGQTGAWTWNGVSGFVSTGDLLSIPRGTKDDIDALLAQVPPLPPMPSPSPLHSLVSSHPQILDAVMVPSRFQATIAADPSREPGRVNVNTCETLVWQAVCAGGPPGRPGSPYQSMGNLLINVANGDQDVRHVNRSLANRLASTSTVRSNVFAIWITVEVTDSAPDAGSPTCHRMFAIVDRSIPALYEKGRNTDVRQTIRVQRFLD
jgi:hypothetical protein